MKYLKTDKLSRTVTSTHSLTHSHIHTHIHTCKCTDKNKIYCENPVSYAYIVPGGIRKIYSFMHKMNTYEVGHVLPCQPTSSQLIGNILDTSEHWESNSRYSRTNLVLVHISPIPCK
jgi:hypothetical protein